MKVASRIEPVVVMGLVVLLGILTYMRNTMWQDEFTIWQDASVKSPHKVRPHNNLGNAMRDDRRMPELAIVEYKKAIALAPEEIPPRHNLVVAYLMLGRLTDAERELKEALLIEPDSHILHGNLGYVYIKQGRLKEAEREFIEALRIKPDYRMARDNLEWIRWMAGATP